MPTENKHSDSPPDVRKHFEFGGNGGPVALVIGRADCVDCGALINGGNRCDDCHQELGSG